MSDISDNANISLAALLSHKDPEIRKHAENILVANETFTQVLIALNDRMENLKLNVQYMAFDLEATRRERDALKGKA